MATPRQTATLYFLCNFCAKYKQTDFVRNVLLLLFLLLDYSSSIQIEHAWSIILVLWRHIYRAQEDCRRWSPPLPPCIRRLVEQRRIRAWSCLSSFGLRRIVFPFVWIRICVEIGKNEVRIPETIKFYNSRNSVEKESVKQHTITKHSGQQNN